MTIGIDAVDFLAAMVAAGLAATITSTLRRTSSAARSPNRSGFPSASRHSMARSRNVAAGMLMLTSGAALVYAFGFNAFTMFPIGFSLLGGILALAARQPDSH